MTAVTNTLNRIVQKIEALSNKPAIAIPKMLENDVQKWTNLVT